MSSSNKTSHLALNQWQRTDPVVMDDFNADNAKVDAAIGGMKMPVVKLLEVVTSAAAAAVELDLSGIDLTQYRALEVCSQAVSDVVKTNAYAYDYLYMRINNDSGSNSYYASSNQSYLAMFPLPNVVNASFPPAAMSITKMYWTTFSGSNNALFGYSDGGYLPSADGAQGVVNSRLNCCYNKFQSISNFRTVNFAAAPRDSGTYLISVGSKFVVYGYLT